MQQVKGVFCRKRKICVVLLSLYLCERHGIKVTLDPWTSFSAAYRMTSFAELLKPLGLIDTYLGAFQRAGVRFEVRVQALLSYSRILRMLMYDLSAFVSETRAAVHWAKYWLTVIQKCVPVSSFSSRPSATRLLVKASSEHSLRIHPHHELGHTTAPANRIWALSRETTWRS